MTWTYESSELAKQIVPAAALSYLPDLNQAPLVSAGPDFVGEVGVRIITASKIKEYFKEMGIRTSGDMNDYVASEVYKIMKKSVVRALQNGRKTVRPWDL